jgi:hypothetical protein
MKVCKLCNIKKPFSEFNKDSVGKNGLKSRCRKCSNQIAIEHYNKNKVKYQLKTKEWTLNNKKQHQSSQQNWRKNNPKYINQYQNQRLKEDILYKVSHNIRARTYDIFKKKGLVKDQTSLNMVGIEGNKLIEYIESKWTNGMNWNNYGKNINNEWSIDHIIPLASANTIKELKILYHYTNLQPLWHIENLKKLNKIL